LVSGPAAILSGTSLTFPAEIVGDTSPEQSVRLTNYGTDPLDISSIAPSSNFAETNNCSSALAAGAACTINATFTPGVAGNLNGTLSINDNAPGSPQMVALSGIGARATTATLTPSTMEFECGYRQSPMWSCSSPDMTTLTNTGTSTMYIQAITIPSESPFSQTNNCTTSLLVGQSCAITVSFYVGQPRQTTGTVNYTSTLSVNDTATGSPQQASLEGASQ
jgi:trimeric autotransporter adhesin